MLSVLCKGKGKGKGKGKKGGKEGGRKQTKTARAGIQFPVGRIGRYIRKGRYCSRLGSSAPVYMAAVLEYLTAEVLELAGNVTREFKRSRITPRYIQLAVRNDEELNQLFKNITIAQGGVIPHIHKDLLPKKREPKKASKEKGKKTSEKTSENKAENKHDETDKKDKQKAKQKAKPPAEPDKKNSHKKGKQPKPDEKGAEKPKPDEKGDKKSNSSKKKGAEKPNSSKKKGAEAKKSHHALGDGYGMRNGVDPKNEVVGKRDRRPTVPIAFKTYPDRR